MRSVLGRAILSRQRNINSKKEFHKLVCPVDTVSGEYHGQFKANSKLFKEYESNKKLALDGGSDKSKQRHVDVNKKTLVRDRLNMLLDEGSDWLEIGLFAGIDMDYGDIPAGGSIMGIGNINGRPCIVSANDATVKGGTLYPIAVKKQLRLQELAFKLRLPCVYLVDSGGAFLPLQAEIFPDDQHGGRSFYNQAVLGACGIPQVAVVCGSCTAGAAYIPTLADDAIIVDRIGSLFLAGPPLVKAALGEIVTSEQLGGATVHCVESGCTDYFARDEEHAVSLCRDLIETLNLPAMQMHDDVNGSRMPLHSAKELDGIAGGKSGSTDFIYQVLARITDESEFHEFKKLFGSSLVVGFSRINGVLVGIIASTGKPITDKCASKAGQLVQMCRQRQVPILFLQNCLHSGYDQKIMKDQTQNALAIKATAQLIAAISCAKVPKITISIGNTYGYESLLGGRAMDSWFSFAWPNSKFCIADPNTELNLNQLIQPALDTQQLDSIDNEQSIRRQLTYESSASYAASRMWIDHIVRPSDTREVLENVMKVVNYSVSTLAEQSPKVTGKQAVLKM